MTYFLQGNHRYHYKSLTHNDNDDDGGGGGGGGGLHFISR